MNLLEAKQALSRKLGIEYSDIANNDQFSDDDLEYYINQGSMQAYDYDFWDFAEHSKTADLDATDITNGYVAYPQDILPSSIYYITIDNKEYDKKLFQSYKKYFQNNSIATDKFWAEFKRMLFFNANACVAGDTIDIYGKQKFRPLTGDTDLLPFSPDTDNEESSGNHACVLLAYSESLASNNKKDFSESEAQFKKGIGILTLLSNQLKQGRATEQSKDRPMFDVPNMFPESSGRGSSNGIFSQ